MGFLPCSTYAKSKIKERMEERQTTSTYKGNIIIELAQPSLCLNGVNVWVRVVLLFSTDVWTKVRAEVIFRIKRKVSADSLLKPIGQFSDDVIRCKTCVKFVNCQEIKKEN